MNAEFGNDAERGNAEHGNDVEWQALCYLLDELDQPQRDRFEQRLATEVAACEALARAVELTAAIQAVEAARPVVALPQRQRSLGRRSLLLVGGGLALVLVAVFALRGPSSSATNGPDSQLAKATTAAESELAIKWLETRALLAAEVSEDDASDDEADDLDSNLHNSLFERLAGDEVDDPAATDGEEFSTPDWLMSALVAQAEQAVESPPATATDEG